MSRLRPHFDGKPAKLLAKTGCILCGCIPLSLLAHSGLEGIDSAKSLTVVLNGSKKAVSVSIPKGNYVVLAQHGQADVDGLNAYTGSVIKAAATSATILAEN